MNRLKNMIKVVAVVLLAPIGLVGCVSHLTAPVTFFPFLMSIRAINFNVGIVTEVVLNRWELLTWVTYVQLVCMLLLPAIGIIADAIESWTKPRPKFQHYAPLKRSELRMVMGIIVLHVVVIGGLTILYFPALRGVLPYPGVRLQRIPAVLALIWGVAVWAILFVSSSGQRVQRPLASRRPVRPQTVNELIRLRLKQRRGRT